MALSILHRVTGIALAAGLVFYTLWLMSMVGGPESYLTFSRVMGSLIGKLMIVAWSFAFFYHLSNGIRHLVWDSGYGFEKQQANRSSLIVIASAVLLTAAFWLLSS
jgi:succinate dehydrogenase / fumarate reductase cytochrome b subunit